MTDAELGGANAPRNEAGAGISRADFADLVADVATGDVGAGSLDMILDIPVTVAVEIGRTRISISDLLKLNPGSVVELDRLAGEPMDITVNGKLIAHGEVVVVNDKFGVRLTDVVSAPERVRKLK
jgi:flagellar motor switch protein FliN/FliY